jgi:hypothetical protein
MRSYRTQLLQVSIWLLIQHFHVAQTQLRGAFRCPSRLDSGYKAHLKTLRQGLHSIGNYSLIANQQNGAIVPSRVLLDDCSFHWRSRIKDSRQIYWNAVCEVTACAHATLGSIKFRLFMGHGGMWVIVLLIWVTLSLLSSG